MKSALAWGSGWQIYSQDVRMYVAVTLRKINLWSRSECQFALTLRNVSLIHGLHKGVNGGRSWGGRCFLAMEGGKDSVAEPSQCTYLMESSVEMSAERSWWLRNSKTKKVKKSVHRRSEKTEKGTRKSSKVESMYWHKPGIVMGSH